MSHYIRTGSAAESRDPARAGGPWEVVGILVAVVPCGVLAGLYLATSEPMFLAAGAVFAVAAVAIIFLRGGGRLRWARPRVAGSADGAERARNARSSGTGTSRVYTLRLLKLLGLALWLLAWGVTASLYAQVIENANIGMLTVFVLVGGLSPIVIYFGLETGVKRLGGRMRDDR